MQCSLTGSPHDDESSYQYYALLSLPQSACHTKDKIIKGREIENQQQTQLLMQNRAECENLSLKIKVRLEVQETYQEQSQEQHFCCSRMRNQCNRSRKRNKSLPVCSQSSRYLRYIIEYLPYTTEGMCSMVVHAQLHCRKMLMVPKLTMWGACSHLLSSTLLSLSLDVVFKLIIYLFLQLENAGWQRLCDAKDKLLEVREAEKQRLEEMLEQRLSDLGISPEQLYDSGTAEKQEMVCWSI